MLSSGLASDMNKSGGNYPASWKFLKGWLVLQRLINMMCSIEDIKDIKDGLA